MKNIYDTMFGMIRHIKRVGQALYLLIKDKSYFLGDSYYPEMRRKTRAGILVDQLTYVFKYGEVDDRYFINGMDRKEFPARKEVLPHAVFKRVRNQLNMHPAQLENYNYVMALRDKFYFSQFLSVIKFPTPMVRMLIDNKQIYYAENGKWLPLESINECKVNGFIKEISGAQGKGVHPIRIEEKRIWFDKKEVSFDYLSEYCFRQKYIVQDQIIQHPAMNLLNKDSINSLRLTTVYDHEEVEVFSAFVRIGAIGSFTDNISRGGSLVGINLQNGKLDQYGFIRYPSGKRVEKHPNTDITYHNYNIPFYKEAVQLAKQLHRFFYHIHSIGWDIAITEDGPCFIEGNDSWGLPFQGFSGGLKEDFHRLFR